MSASPYAQRAAPLGSEAWRAGAPTQPSSSMQPNMAPRMPSGQPTPSGSSPYPAYTGSQGAPANAAAIAVGGSTQRAPAPVAAEDRMSAHDRITSGTSSGPTTAASEMGAAVAAVAQASGYSVLGPGMANSSRDEERYAAKARKMSPNGSRMPSSERARSHVEDAADRGEGPSSPSQRNPARDGELSNGLDNSSRPQAVEFAQRHMLKRQGGPDADTQPHLNLATFPPQDLLRVLAALLHQIATANDQLRPVAGQAGAISVGGTGAAPGDRKRRHRDQNAQGAGPSSPARDGKGREDLSDASSAVVSPAVGSTLGGPDLGSDGRPRPHPTTAALAALQAPTSTLCFHARNVPSISIEAYLMRILKYCPTTNEVFLSLLVYFDRMSRMGHGTGSAAQSRRASAEKVVDGAAGADGVTTASPDLARSTSGAEGLDPSGKTAAITTDGLAADGEPHVGIRGFAIDSYNVHRLVIAGVTVASKFFSDVFYTNSRYAKVGGLPVNELNQLELQFLLLNDFSLMIPLEEMQHYADQLLYYAGAPRFVARHGDESGGKDAKAPDAATASSQAAHADQGDTAMRTA